MQNSGNQSTSSPLVFFLLCHAKLLELALNIVFVKICKAHGCGGNLGLVFLACYAAMKVVLDAIQFFVPIDDVIAFKTPHLIMYSIQQVMVIFVQFLSSTWDALNTLGKLKNKHTTMNNSMELKNKHPDVEKYTCVLQYR